MSYRLGIDVGGTNTDVVLLDGDNRVVAKRKRPDSSDIMTGIRDAVRAVLDDSGVDPAAISQAMLGT
ncbi:MAG: hydantoinase/oxoprolinase family protein, partial [Alicyclobacillus shizuokensis]|nr:hydantoinase/oxoprolinase family protein [Alicyclobacillus shizuokensis]